MAEAVTLLCSISFLPSPQHSGFMDMDADSDVSCTLQNQACVFHRQCVENDSYHII